MLCPRRCGINRLEGEKSICGETASLKIAAACLHFGEEPTITAQGGSGTIFISGCNLGCTFCQNYQISHQGMGSIVTSEEFAEICLALERAGAENINIVTGSHAAPAIAEGIKKAKERGILIPFCWNSSAYESPEALNMLDGLIDIWLPDLKTLNPLMSKSLFHTDSYPAAAKNAIRHMLEFSPLSFVTLPAKAAAQSEQSMRQNKISVQTRRSCQKMLSGVIIRHLVLPGRIADTILVLDWLKKNADDRACISLMSQYTPVKAQKTSLEQISAFENRFISKNEFKQLSRLIKEYQFSYLFHQALLKDDSWLPDFNRLQPFSNSLAKPIWHWKEGFIKDS